MLKPFGTVFLEDVGNERDVPGHLVPLDRDMARKLIDDQWWKEEWLDRPKRRQAEDRSWRWRKVVGYFQSNHTVRLVAILTEDGKCQGAIAFNPMFKSELDPQNRAVYVEFLASAPRNRSQYAPFVTYKGVGTWLLREAVRYSMSLGPAYGGRVTLSPLPGALVWYKNKMDFQETTRRTSDRLLLELPPDAAREMLHLAYRELHETFVTGH